MSRFFTPVSLDKFKAALKPYKEWAGDYDRIYWNEPDCSTEQVVKDLSKINFSMENRSCDVNDFNNSPSLIGFNKLDNGLWFLGYLAGGDWEHPLFFIIYHDGNKLRGYIPEKGNKYNHKTKAAYGNEDDYGLDYLSDEEDDLIDKTPWDNEALIKDIESRILKK